MLTFKSFVEKLERDRNRNDWIRVFVDKHGNYHLCAYAGMGDIMFQELKSDHPFVTYITDLENQKKFERGSFCKEYYAGGVELAELILISAK